MHDLNLYNNQLNGKHFFAHMAQLVLVYESTADGCVPENALAGAIPTEIGQLAQLVDLDLHGNHTGASKNSLDCNFGVRVYNNLKKTSLLRRYNPDGAGALHGYDAPLAEPKRIER